MWDTGGGGGESGVTTGSVHKSPLAGSALGACEGHLHLPTEARVGPGPQQIPGRFPLAVDAEMCPLVVAG